MAIRTTGALLLNPKGRRPATGVRVYAQASGRGKTRKNAGLRKTVRHNGHNGMLKRAETRVTSMLSKIPLVGGFLAPLGGLIPPALLSAIAVEPTLFVAQNAPRVPVLGPLLEQIPTPLYFLAAGGLTALAIHKIPLGSPQVRHDLAVAAASGAAAVSYFTWRTGGDAGEATADATSLGDAVGGALADATGLGDVGAILEDDYAGYSAADAVDDSLVNPTGEEVEAAVRGPRAWRRRFPRARGYANRARGVQGHRYGWLIQALGFQRVSQIMALPPVQRTQVLAILRDKAYRAASTEAAAQGFGALVPGAMAAPMGALMPGTMAAPMGALMPGVLSGTGSMY